MPVDLAILVARLKNGSCARRSRFMDTRFELARPAGRFSRARYAFLGYEEADSTWPRIVCENRDPRCHVLGMRAYPMRDVDPALDGWYGVHCGDADEWLPILDRDGYCDGDAYVYELHLDRWNDAHARPENHFYQMDDPHVVDRTATPDSLIVFSRYETIAARLVTFQKRVPEAEIHRITRPRAWTHFLRQDT